MLSLYYARPSRLFWTFPPGECALSPAEFVGSQGAMVNVSVECVGQAGNKAMVVSRGLWAMEKELLDGWQ